MTATESNLQATDTDQARPSEPTAGAADAPAEAGAGLRARGPPGRRGRPRDRVAQAELRQGAVPRPAPARPDRPVAAPRAGERGRGEAFLAKLRRTTPRRRSTARRSSGTPASPTRCSSGLAELGAFGMKIDEKYGGLGLSNLDYCRALMLVGSANPAIGALLSAHQSIGVPQPLKLFGTEEQKQRFLPRLAAGEISAFLLTEPDVGSDPARLAHHRGRRPRADYVLNGVKLWATNGIVADLLVVMAQVPRRRRGTGAASPRSSSRPTRRGSPSSGATPSWACAAWRTA